MHKILVIRLYFPLDVLHVSDCISPTSGATFYKLYIAFGICRYHTARRMVYIRIVLFYTFNSLDFPWDINCFSGMFWDLV